MRVPYTPLVEAAINEYAETPEDRLTVLMEHEKAGATIIYPKTNELQIDIDTESGYAQFLATLDLIDNKFGVKDTEILPSRSGLPHRHIVVTLHTNISDRTRVALQACLGSDPKREILAIYRIENNLPHATCLFQYEEKK